MHNRYGFNPRKCNSASTLSGCIEREMSRVIIALPTSNEVLDIFEQTITGGFSCMNNPLAFDSKTFLPNTKKKEDNYRKDYQFKVVYHIKLDNEKPQPKRVITKVFKLNENNQYGFGMTKLLPTGCIEADSHISFKKLNDLIRTLDIDSPIRHLYVADIEFDHENATENQITYNEIYPPHIEKQKIIDPCERSIYQLLEQYSTTDKGKPKSYKATKKARATMSKKNFQPMYLEQIFFSVVRAGWKITKIYLHYTFEQERFKKDFILMNQKPRQNAKNSVEKDFYKLINNSNFGFDCRNNLDNCKFVPIFDELKEITNIKKYYNFFDPKVSKFVMPDLIAQEIEEKYNDDIIKISTEDKFYKLNLLLIQRKLKRLNHLKNLRI